LAELAAAHLGLPVREVFECSTEAASPVEGSTRLRQVRERLRLRQFDVLDGAVLLVDEFTRRKWTLTQATHLLADIKVDEVVPLVVGGV